MAVGDKFATRDEVRRLNDFMGIFVVVLFLGFAAMFGTLATLVISHFDTNGAAFDDLKSKVDEQNGKVDMLIEQGRQTPAPSPEASPR